MLFCATIPPNLRNPEPDGTVHRANCWAVCILVCASSLSQVEALSVPEEDSVPQLVPQPHNPSGPHQMNCCHVTCLEADTRSSLVVCGETHSPGCLVSCSNNGVGC